MARLQEELLKPGTLAYITKALEREAKKLRTAPRDGMAATKRLEQERRKLQNLISALEGGSSSPAAVLNAIGERERIIGELEAQVRSFGGQNRPRTVDSSPEWVKQQLSDLAGFLKDDVPRVKSEFRRLNLALTFTPVEGEPRPHYVVNGQCDLGALAFSFVRAAGRPISSTHRSGAVKDLTRGSQVQNRSQFC